MYGVYILASKYGIRPPGVLRVYGENEQQTLLDPKWLDWSSSPDEENRRGISATKTSSLMKFQGRHDAGEQWLKGYSSFSCDGEQLASSEVSTQNGSMAGDKMVLYWVSGCHVVPGEWDRWLIQGEAEVKLITM